MIRKAFRKLQPPDDVNTSVLQRGTIQGKRTRKERGGQEMVGQASACRFWRTAKKIKPRQAEACPTKEVCRAPRSLTKRCASVSVFPSNQWNRERLRLLVLMQEDEPAENNRRVEWRKVQQ